MKSCRKIITFLLVAVLLLSTVSVASAATVVGSGDYYYKVNKTDSTTSNTVVSSHLTNHVQGTADSIAYSVTARTYTFSTNKFPVDYRTYLVEAYEKAGFKTKLPVPASSGYKTVAASAATGTYQVVLSYTHGEGSWEVSVAENTVITNGTFSSAPISYTIRAIRT